jgi:hypothetical protein
MRKKEEIIQTEAYIRLGDKLVNIESMTPEERTIWDTKRKVLYLNELFAGKLRFTEIELPAKGKGEKT